MRNKIKQDYFEWMCEIVCGDRFAPDVSYVKLLTHLHSVEFRYSIPKDENRAEDGLDLRYRFGLIVCHNDRMREYIDGPCSVLEMMLALAIRCEETIMDDASIGDRTGQWFWGMISNLGLQSMIDERYDEVYVDEVIERLLNREYGRDGKGGLFTVRYCDYDLRRVEIWDQLNWYLNSIT